MGGGEGFFPKEMIQDVLEPPVVVIESTSDTWLTVLVAALGLGTALAPIILWYLKRKKKNQPPSDA